jgi:transposase
MTIERVAEKPFQPKYRLVNRDQLQWGTIDVESLIAWDHPARAIWELTGRLDLKRFEDAILSEEEQAGRPCWPPRLLISVWTYGYSIGVASARALSRLMEHEPGLRWLTAAEMVNHHTLSDFRVRHGEALKAVFTQVLAAMDEEGLLDLSTLVQDGTKLRAVAGNGSLHRENTLRQRLEQAEQAVAEMERRAGEESESADERRKSARQRSARERVERLQAAVEELQARQKEVAAGEQSEVRVSDSEPEARKMKHADGGWAPSYNVQVSTEPKSRVIVSVDVTTDRNDTQQLEPAAERFFANTGRWPEMVIADSGYATRKNVEAMSSREIDLIAPWKEESGRQAGANKVHGREAAFSSEQFQSDGKGGLVCPAGQILVQIGTRKEKGVLHDVYAAAPEACRACVHQQACCGRSQRPRRVQRVLESDAMRAYLQRMEQPEAQQVYKLRCAVAEFPHLIVKARWKWVRFSVRGRVKANIEAMWVALSYNLRQWIRLRPPAPTTA